MASDVETCLRVLAEARAADPGDERWTRVREAAAQVYRADKKARKAARNADRRRHDDVVTAAAERHRDQNPGSAPPVDTPAGSRPPVGTPPGSRPPVGTPTESRPPVDTPTGSRPPVDTPAGSRPLIGTRRCYVCKAAYDRVDSVYHRLCPACAEENLARRVARCDLRGRRALVTGGRVKIGFHTALKLLRDGAEVLVTTRFPADAARRYAAVPDADRWLDRLHVHGVDLLDLPGVAGLLETVHERFDHLDILVNNAAQTIRRPAAYHREVLAAEDVPLEGLAARIRRTTGHRPASTASIGTSIGTSIGGAVGTSIGAAAGIRLDNAGSAAAIAASPGIGVAGATAPESLTAVPDLEALFPAGMLDETGEPLDLRDRNSWSLRLHEVDPAEWLEVQLVNSFAPFLLTSRLRGLLEASPHPDRYVVQVSAMEGSFSRANKTVRHPHTNMAKAALNMLTRTAAPDYAASGIHMNSVDTGWCTDERPHPERAASGFRPPLDVIDGAARVYDPVVRGVGGDPVSGLFLKDYRSVEW
ncbi:SDR family NAD(P)-dependent oxidoreductase [Herbidospora daliensis]|uniref:SDR family NAD(P)-dependent oxidoreductase n=1 Tax=Herbidospora daliensis TaxID=295585 RepID=UPI000783D44A|nr:SDR family NAD(P)-dependent oxidoreductase [Herbidospora daliensis]